MLEADRQAFIRYAQCKYALHADKVRKALQYGKRNEQCLSKDMIVANEFIQMLYNYTAFTAAVTFSAAITFTKTSSSSDDVTVTIGGTAFGPYTTTGDGEDIASYFYNLFTDNTTSPDYFAEFNDNVLYVYSYDTSLSYSTTLTVTSANSLTTSSITKASTVEDEILEFWNCLTEDQMCDVVQYLLQLVDSDKPCLC